MSTAKPTIVQVKIVGAVYIWAALTDVEGHEAFGRVLKGVMKKLCNEVPNSIVGMLQWDTITVLMQQNSEETWLGCSVSRIISKVISIAAMEFMLLWRKEVEYSNWFWYINLDTVGLEFTASAFNIEPANVPKLFQLEEYLARRNSLETGCEVWLNNGSKYVGKGYEPDALLDKLASMRRKWSDVPAEYRQGVLCVPTNEQRFVVQNIETGVQESLGFLPTVFTAVQERKSDWRDILEAAFLRSF